MGVEPIGDRVTCRPPVLKTGTITGPHALPQIHNRTAPLLQYASSHVRRGLVLSGHDAIVAKRVLVSS